MQAEEREIVLRLLRSLREQVLTARLADGARVCDVSDVRVWLTERIAALGCEHNFE